MYKYQSVNGHTVVNKVKEKNFVMEISLTQRFSTLSENLCSVLSVKEHEKEIVNSLIDELNALPYKSQLFIRKHDAGALINILCFNIKPEDEFVSAKASHLINSIIIKQNVQFSSEFLDKVILWHIECLKKCSEIILLDILHNLQCILQSNPQAALKFADTLIGKRGLVINFLNVNSNNQLQAENTLQISLFVFKCILCLITILDENKPVDEQSISTVDVKENISNAVITFLLKGLNKSQDESLYCKVVISALRVLSHLYFHEQSINFSLPELIGICRHFILYGLVIQNTKPDKIMPSQQSIAPAPIKITPKGGKKQKLRKQRNNAIESLKKEIPVTDHSLMKDVDNFENNSAYKPITKNYLEPQRARNCWVLTSDSDMSDIENSREAKMIALKSRVRQSAANLFLVLFKIKEKKDIYGYWWALLPDSPNIDNWYADTNSKKTLAYCAIVDPIASSRASALSVTLALLSGSRMYLAQAEISKKQNASFIPFSISLGYLITCMHKVITGVLDNERSHSVIIVALKCCAALVQATPYHKMQEGMISELVRSTRRFLVHKDVTLQVGALITIGCILSIDPKVDEVLKALEKDSSLPRFSNLQISKEKDSENQEYDDFEEGYSDDEMIECKENEVVNDNVTKESDKFQVGSCFKSWLLDICFKNLGWLFKGDERLQCTPSAIPIILESLQVLSAIAFHHLGDILKPHITLMADVLCDLLQHENHDVVLQAARTVSVIADGIQKLEQADEAPPLQHCVYMWGKLLTPLSAILQSHENSAAKTVVCDCIANIGEKSFKEIPSRQQMLCCTLLVGSCSDEEAAVRAAAVRALAMAVMFRTLREDIYFVSDCGENILRALAEPSLVVVRVKAAWALGNLSDALVLNMEEPELENIDDNLLVRLLEVSIRCANDNDKVKMSATRALGNLLRLINRENLLHNPQIRTLCESAIEKLLDCACKVTNMKVRWNACYALGNAMKNEQLFISFNGWQGKVFTSLCALSRECKNLKVRINATVALRSCKHRELIAGHLFSLCRGLLEAMDSAAHLDDFAEHRHKDNLIEQLCVTLAHICCFLQPSDLADILDLLVFHGECAKSLYAQVYQKLPPENASCLKILQAAKYVTMDLIAENETQAQSLGMLQEIFILDL